MDPPTHTGDQDGVLAAWLGTGLTEFSRSFRVWTRGWKIALSPLVFASLFQIKFNNHKEKADRYKIHRYNTAMC